MNRTQKGKLIEQKAQDIIAKDGYWIEKARRAKFQAQDLFGCWDLLAVGKKETRFIQVSTERFSSRSRADQERMLAFPKPPGTTKEYWRWNEKSGTFEFQSYENETGNFGVDSRLALGGKTASRDCYSESRGPQRR